MLYNSEKKLGLQENFDPQSVESLDASWTDSGSLFKLGFKTKVFTLKPDDFFTFSYDFKIINKIP